MKDFINIGSTPFEEDCAQVGSDNYEQVSRIECNRYRDLLKELYPAGNFKVKSFPHDFGSYLEVVAYYDEDDENQDAIHAAYEAETSTYGTWKELEEAVKAKKLIKV